MSNKRIKTQSNVLEAISYSISYQAYLIRKQTNTKNNNKNNSTHIHFPKQSCKYINTRCFLNKIKNRYSKATIKQNGNKRYN